MRNEDLPIDERVTFVRWDDKHIKQLPGVANNLKISANMADRFPSPYTHQDASNFVKKMMLCSETHSWAIELDGHLVGGIGLSIRTGAAFHSTGLAYWLGEEYWGKGIASYAVKNIVTYVFDTIKLVRIETTVFHWNSASVRVLEKCGFTKEGTLKSSFIKNGKIVDRYVFSLIEKKNFALFESDPV